MKVSDRRQSTKERRGYPEERSFLVLPFERSENVVWQRSIKVGSHPDFAPCTAWCAFGLLLNEGHQARNGFVCLGDDNLFAGCHTGEKCNYPDLSF